MDNRKQRARVRRAASGVAAVVFIAGALVFAGPWKSEAGPAGGDGSEVGVRRVRVAPVIARSVGRELRLYGTTRAARRATLAFTLGGRLQLRPVRVGDEVRRGQIVAALDPRPLRNGVSAARAELQGTDARRAQLARELARYRALYSNRAIPKQQLERASNGVDLARAGKQGRRVQLREARRLLRETRLRAPFAGIVTAVHLEPGEYARPGRGVISLASRSEVEIEVEAPERSIAGLRRGQAVRVDLPLMGRRGLSATLRSLGHAARGPGQLFPLLIALEAKERVLPGVTAEVVLRRPSQSALFVPVAAVVDPTGGAPSLFVLRGQRVRRLKVHVGELRGSEVAVASAPGVAGDDRLRGADRVVVAGLVGLFSGDEVSVAGVSRRRRAARLEGGARR